MRLGVVIGTCDKIEEARLQIELIRKIWTPIFEDIKIVHAYNGTEKYEKTLEDDVVIVDNPSHFVGAANLMDKGIKKILDKYDVDYILVNASDCWWMLPDKIVKICDGMRLGGCKIASCVWGYPGQLDRRKKGLACDTFFIDAKQEKINPIFPLRAQEFLDKNIDMIVYYRGSFKIERLLATRYIQSIMNTCSEEYVVAECNKQLYHLKEREPTMQSSGRITPAKRNFDCIKLGLYTNHDFNKKREILRKLTNI